MDSQRDLVLASVMRDNQKDVTPIRSVKVPSIMPDDLMEKAIEAAHRFEEEMPKLLTPAAVAKLREAEAKATERFLFGNDAT